MNDKPTTILVLGGGNIGLSAVLKQALREGILSICPINPPIEVPKLVGPSPELLAAMKVSAKASAIDNSFRGGSIGKGGKVKYQRK